MYWVYFHPVQIINGEVQMKLMRVGIALVVSAFMACFTQAEGVAKIGDTPYATIDAAIKAVQDGETIELLSDITVSGYFVYNKSFTIDGKGKTITCASANTNYPNYFVNVANGYAQTFKNVTINANEKVPYAIQCIGSTSKLTLDNVTVQGGKTMKTKGKNDTYSKTRLGYGIHVNQGTVIAKDLTVKNCTVLPVYLDGTSSSVSLSGDKCDLDLIGTAGLNETVSSSAKGFYAYEVTASYKFIWTSTKEVRVISSLPWNEVISKVGDYTDFTVQNATVKLLQDVVLSETFTSNNTKLTIDGNNKAITGTIKFTTSPSTIKNVVLGDDATLDCTASTTTGFSSVSVAANATIDILLPSTTDISKYSLPVALGTNAIANITVGDKKYIAKGNVITPAETLAQVGDKQYVTLQAAIDAANDATIHVLKDVALTASLNIPAGKTLTLNLAGRKVTITGANYALINNGELTIIDQELVAVEEETSAQNDDVVPFLITCAASNDGVVALDDATGGSIAGVQNNGTFALESGAVVAASASVPAIDNKANAVATITGGTVEGKLQSVDKSALTVTGGSFTGNSNVSDFVGGNYGVDDNGTVISYVAQLGATKYQTLQEAFAAAKEFDIVTVLDTEADVSGIAGYVAEGLFPISNGDKTYTLRAMPAATVEKLPAFTLTKARDAYACWPEGDKDMNRPLDIVMNFLANDDGKAEANETGFSDWKCDFYLTFSDMAGASLEADGCYLAGNYGGYGWIVIPADDTIIDNNATLPVVAAYDANITYRQVCDTVKKFTAAIHVADAVMTANPDLKITLQLKMTNNKDASQELVVGSYTYTIEDLKGEFNPTVKVEEGATVTDTFKATVGSGLANAYQATEGKLEVTVVEQAETFATLDVSAMDGYEVPAEGLEMTFPAQSVEDNAPAIIVHKHEGRYYVTTGLVEYGFVTYNNTLGFSEFIVGDVAALNAALAEGGEVILSGDIVLTEPLTIPEGKTVTLDLNGKTMTGVFNGSSTTNHIYALKNYGTLTITDTSAEQNGAINSRGVYNYGSLTLNAGKIAAVDGNGGYAVNNESGSTFVMNGGWIAADYEDGDAPEASNYDATALDVPAGCTATLNGGKITNAGNYTFAIAAAGTLNIPVTSTIAVEGRHGAIAVSGGTTTINAGTFKIPANTENTDNVLYVSGGALIINGGTFTGDSDTVAGGCCVYDANGGATINGGTFGNTSGGDVWGTTGTIIKGGTFSNLTETEHIADGFKLDENGQVVEDPKNIEVTDANGNVTYYAGFTGFSDLDLADCTIKLLNNVSDANLILNKGSTSKIVDTNVTLDLNGYTFSRTGSSSGAINLTNGAGLTIRDSSDAKTGKILVDTYAVWMMNGDFVLESGTIETTSTKNAAIYANAAEVAIKAGKIVSAGDAITVGENFMESRGTSTIEISGGEIVAAGVGIKNGSYAQDSTAVTVTGGTIDAEGDSISFTKGSVQVSGGTFSSDVSDYCVDGFEVKQNADGSYAVAANPAYGKVAKIGDEYYATLSAAFAAVTADNQTVTILKDVTEELTGAYPRGNITTENDAKVTITLTNSDWVYCPYTFVLGANVTLKCPALFYYAGGTQINGTLIVDAYYQRYGNTKLTINEPGSMTVRSEMFYLRYTDGDANAGIYINGDKDDSTIGLKASVIYFYQGMINAKDATIQTSVYWQTNNTDNQGSANLVLNNSKMTVTGNELNVQATGNSTVTMDASSRIVTASKFLGAGTIKVDATNFTGPATTLIKANMSAFTGTIEVVGNPLATYETTADGLVLDVALAGAGTEADPFVVDSVATLKFFRDSVNAGETKYNASGVYVALAADIDMTGIDWSVNIGDAADTSFDGIFDGKGKTIRNLKSVESAKDPWGYICTGLFGCIAGEAQVKNLTLENVDITAEYVGNNVAALVGFAYNCKGTIDNVTVKNVKINATNATGVGAIVGYDYYSPALKVTNCTVDGTSIAGAAYVGGVIGYASTKIQLNNNTVKNLTLSGTASVGGVAGIMLAGGSASDNTIDAVTLSATGAMWANSVGAVAGTMTNGSITVAGTTVTGGNVTGIVGGILVEKPTTPIEKVQAKVGDTYYTTFERAADAATECQSVTLLVPPTANEDVEITAGQLTGAKAYDAATLLGGTFKKSGDKLVYDYAFGVSNVTYKGGDDFTLTIAIEDADSTVTRTLTGRTLLITMKVDGEVVETFTEPNPEFVAANGQVTCDVDVELPTLILGNGEGKATYFEVKVSDAAVVAP